MQTRVERRPRANLQRQAATPLLDALLRYHQDGVVRFHMPGHRGGPGADWRLRQLWGPEVFSLDVTGVPGLDDPHQPSGPIREAQQLAAEAFGADASFFLVNGTTAGVQAMVLATCRPGDTLVVARNVHRSIMSAIILTGVIPVFVQPEMDPEFGIALGVTPQTVEPALARHPDARAVLLVSPTYHGIVSDVSAVAEVVHRHGKLLLVDEAHGSHLAFHPDLPAPSIWCGADMCAQGVHKMLAGLTQASILHVRADRVDPARVAAALRLVQSTSASYLLMASVDVARMQMATAGPTLLAQALELAEQLRQRVGRVATLRTFGREWVGRPGVAGMDPTKVTVQVCDLGLTGHAAERLLRELGPVQAEMSELRNLLFIVGFGNSPDDVERLAGTLEYIAEHAADYRTPEMGRLLAQAERLEPRLPLPELAVPPREAFFAPSRPVPLEEACGQVCTEVVTCYPPGIPILCPGERISAEVAEYLTVVRQAGLPVSGPRDPSLRTLQVL